MKAIILARVSDKKQDSNEAQVSRVSDYIKHKQLTIWKTYEIEESSTSGDRKKFQEVIRDIENSKEPVALVVDTVDRLQRSFKESVLLDDLRKAGKLEIHFYRENLLLHKDSNSSDLLRWDMAVMFARSYVLQLSDNVKRSFEQKRRNGEWTGPVRIGYLNVTLDKEKRLRKNIIPDPERGHLIQALFELYATGNYSIRTAWDKITVMGLRNKSGKKLSRSNIELILKDPFYYGMARSKKYGLYPHRYRTLITKELFDKCQEVMRGRSKKPSKMTLNEYMFQGLLPCANCGCLYSPEYHKKPSGKEYTLYGCTNAKRICKRTYVNEKELLKPIYEVFEAFKAIPQEVQEGLVEELRGLNETEAEFHQKELNRIRTEYDRAQSKVNKLLDLRLEESITKDDYDKKLRELKDHQYRLGIELEEYTKADHEYHIHVSTVLNLSRRMGDVFESSETLEKRAILNFLLQNPTVSGKKLEFTLRKPFDTVLELAGCPNWLRGEDSNLR